MWVISFLTYFNCCPAFLTRLKFSSPSGVHLLFHVKEREFVFRHNLNPVLFRLRGGGSSGFQISAVNYRCWFPAALSTVCWNSSNQSFISFTLSCLLTPLNRHPCRRRGILLGGNALWTFQKVKTQPGQLRTPICIRQSLTPVPIFRRRGIRNT